MSDLRKEVTGRTVFLCLAGFFAVVASVNAIMIRAAVSTFGGVETESSYKAGLAFARELAAVRAQDALHWQVQVALTPQSHHQRIEVLVRDREGKAPFGVTAVARLAHPTDRRSDIAIELPEISAGRYAAEASPAAGQWDLIVELARGEERLFRSKSRMIIKPM
jgi:nitrogen fixation protein FixH